MKARLEPPHAGLSRRKSLEPPLNMISSQDGTEARPLLRGVRRAGGCSAAGFSTFDRPIKWYVDHGCLKEVR